MISFDLFLSSPKRGELWEVGGTNWQYCRTDPEQSSLLYHVHHENLSTESTLDVLSINTQVAGSIGMFK
jgi:hypothetical protein